MERPVRSILILYSTNVVERVPWFMFDSTWYGSNKWNTKIPIDVTFLAFQTNGEAKKMGKLLAALDHPSIPRFLEYKYRSGVYPVVVERLTSLGIQEWWDQGVGETCM